MTTFSPPSGMPIAPVFVGAMPFQSPSVWVNSANTIGIPAAWRALNLITDIVGQCSPCVMQGNECVDGTFVTNPSPFYTPFEFYKEVATDLVLNGNAVLVVIRNPDGSVAQLLPLPTENMVIQYRDGKASYQWQGYEFDASAVLHIRATTTPGVLRGIGVIESQRRSLGIAIDQQEYQSSGMRSGGVPSVIIKMPVNASNFTPALAEQVQTDWLASFGSAQRLPAIVPSGMDISTLAFSPDDMQFLQSKAMTIAEVAYMFGLSPSDLGAAISAADKVLYANITQASADLLRRVNPWMTRMGQRLDTLLPQGQCTHFQTDRMLKADTNERYTAYNLALQGGWMTKDEVREKEGLGPMEIDPAPVADSTQEDSKEMVMS